MPPLAGFGPSSFSGIHCGIHLGKTGGPKPAENLDSDRHRLNSLFGRLGNLLAAMWKTNALPDRIASRNSTKAIFPDIFPSAREVPQLFGLVPSCIS